VYSTLVAAAAELLRSIDRLVIFAADANAGTNVGTARVKIKLRLTKQVINGRPKYLTIFISSLPLFISIC
jgi:hypothetical protein